MQNENDLTSLLYNGIATPEQLRAEFEKMLSEAAAKADAKRAEEMAKREAEKLAKEAEDEKLTKIALAKDGLACSIVEYLEAAGFVDSNKLSDAWYDELIKYIDDVTTTLKFYTKYFKF